MKSGECLHCGGTKVGRLATLRDVGHNNQAHARALAVSEKAGWSGRSWIPQAEVEAYLCTECGYFEEYVSAPKDVPWASLEGFTWVKQGSSE